MVDDKGSGSTRILRRPVRREQPKDDFEEEEDDDEIEPEIEDIFRRSWRRSAIFQLLESLRDDDKDRETEMMRV
jgi:hypothetical protein